MVNHISSSPNYCPLCESRRIVLHRWFDLDSVRAEWLRGFGFDPFMGNDLPKQLEQYKCLNCDLKFFYPAICGDGEFYEELSNRFDWYYEKDKWEFDIAIDILSGLDGIEDVLEVGCGQGHFLRRIKTLYNAVGIELNPKAIRECEAFGLKVSGRPLESVSEKFNAIVTFEVLEHVSNPRAFIEDMLRLLRPNGYLLLAVPDPQGYFSEAERILLDMPPHHVLSFSKKTFLKISELLDLDLLEVHQEPLRFVHYKSYISNFVCPDEPLSGRGQLIHKLFEKFFGIPWGLIARRLEQRLEDIILAASYQNNKEKLLGQTHLALFKKR